MKAFILVCKEISHRKVNFLLAVVCVVFAAGMYCAFNMTARASENETRKLMLELGQNLRIIPAETEMDEFWIRGFSEHTMPEDYVYRFVEKTGYSYTHLTATLHRSIEYCGAKVVLTGILPEVFPPDKSWQKPMTFTIKQGQAYVGSEVSQRMGIATGDQIEIRGKRLDTVKVLSPTGSVDDIRIYGHLRDVQSIMNMPGRINEIKALECMCFRNTDADPLKAAQRQLKQLLPEGKVLLLDGISHIRIRQRTTIQKHMKFILNATLGGCGVMIAILAMINVRQRKIETGVLRALGYTSKFVFSMFMAKAAMVAVIGTSAGFFAGSWIAVSLGDELFPVTADAIKFDYSLLYKSLVWCGVLVTIASFLPALWAVMTEPADNLREE